MTRNDSTQVRDAAAVGPAPATDPTPGAATRRRHTLGWWAARVGLTLVVLALVLVVAGSFLYRFGTMETPAPAMQAAYAVLVASGGVAPIAPAVGLHVPIPGCTCHSPDPVLQMQHRYRTISECSRCHG